jgi:hypothetical protein
VEKVVTAFFNMTIDRATSQAAKGEGGKEWGREECNENENKLMGMQRV